MLLDAVPPARRAVHAVARALLVRVLAVAQRLVGAIEREHDVCGQLLALLQPLDDRRVVRGRARRTPRARRRRRVASLTEPSLARSSSSSGAYWSGLVTIVTHAWFFAAARVIAGPPMSIVSMSGRSKNGYRFETTRSKPRMPCVSRSARCDSLPRSASRPPWIFGCSVFTRPSSISGEPVTSSTRVTGMPASASAADVLPDDTSSTPSSCSAARQLDEAGLVPTESQRLRSAPRSDLERSAVRARISAWRHDVHPRARGPSARSHRGTSGARPP